MPNIEGTLHASVLGSPVAKGHIKKIDYQKALELPGVVAVYTAKDIPGENQIGSIIQDEPLMGDHEVDFVGMPIALVVATTEVISRKALKYIDVEIEELPPILDPRVAHKEKQFIVPSRTFAMGDVANIWKKCKHVFEGRVDMGGQEHIYLETQGAYVVPGDNGLLHVYSSTQANAYVQKGISKVLGLPWHQIEVDVVRIGGGFGGKEDQGTPWASLASLAAYKLKKPVKLILRREDDIKMTGKRHPYSFDYKIGVDENLKILGYQVECFQNAGASADVSPAVMERTLFHGGGSYFIPNIKVTAHSCRTNLPPNTAFRGFGAPQAMFAVEAAVNRVAHELGVSASEVQQRNLLNEGDAFSYGQMAHGCNAHKCWDQAEERYNLKQLQNEVEKFNRDNKTVKKGISVFPLCFGISFTKTSLNQGRSLVHVYTDGSVSVSTGVVEMGQGVNTKILEAAARVFSVAPSRIRIISTNTTRVANASPTAASSGADLNGKATQVACNAIKSRLLEHAGKLLGVTDLSKLDIRDEVVTHDGAPTALTWKKLIMEAYEARVSMSEHGHYGTPHIHFDKSKEKGHPFAYHVYGNAITVVKLDCIRGIYDVESVQIVHDFGSSFNFDIDRGQVEGALLQGIGLMSIEELVFNDDGTLRTNSLSSYKIPDIYTTPRTVDVEPLQSTPNEMALLGSKAVGEPPLMYGIGTFFAVQQAIREFNPKYDCKMTTPMTYQMVMRSLYE